MCAVGHEHGPGTGKSGNRNGALEGSLGCGGCGASQGFRHAKHATFVGVRRPSGWPGAWCRAPTRERQDMTKPGSRVRWVDRRHSGHRGAGSVGDPRRRVAGGGRATMADSSRKPVHGGSGSTDPPARRRVYGWSGARSGAYRARPAGRVTGDIGWVSTGTDGRFRSSGIADGQARLGQGEAVTSRAPGDNG